MILSLYLFHEKMVGMIHFSKETMVDFIILFNKGIVLIQ